MPSSSAVFARITIACPVAKRESHRLALRAAATSGDSRFFLGTDSAPHVDPLKECACGCAGIYTSINTMSCLAHVFEQEGALDKLEAFASLSGPAWYGVDANEETITLIRRIESVAFPDRIETGAGPVTVFDPMFPLHWDVESLAANPIVTVSDYQHMLSRKNLGRFLQFLVGWVRNWIPLTD